MRFVKMQGLGNDYIYLNCLAGAPADLPALARRMSDRHFGVGADGLICLFPSREHDFTMRMFNADGSEGAMCGNGLRCLGKFAYDQGLTGRTDLTFDTGAGPRRLRLLLEGGRVAAAEADMGPPQIGRPAEAEAGGRIWRLTPVSMGNPHRVAFVEDPDALDLAVLGPALERGPAFPGRANVEFAAVEGPGRLRARVWERGSGETLACGTGACAVLAAAVAEGLAEPEARVELPGGALSVRWDRAAGTMFLTGPAVTVYEGDYPLEDR